LDAFELADRNDSEIGDLNGSEIGQLRSHETRLTMLLGENDVAAIAEAVDPSSSAAVLVWENCWAAPFAAAVRHSDGQLVASGQIAPRQVAYQPPRSEHQG